MSPILESRDPLPGKVLKRTFAVGDRVGSGAVYDVYQARQLSVANRKVAVKVVKKALCRQEDPEAAIHLRHYEFEKGLLSNLRSTTFAGLIDAGSVLDGEIERPYLITEFLPGKQLSEVLSVSGPMSTEGALSVFLILAEGLEELNEFEVAYRDLSPANVIIQYGKDGTAIPRLFDFSHSTSFSKAVAAEKRGRNWVLAGTPPYAAPELTAGQADPRSDVYSLGSILYFLLAGIPATGTGAGTWKDYIAIIKDGPRLPHRSLKSLGVSQGLDLDPLLEIALRIQPRDRFQSVREFVSNVSRTVLSDKGPLMQGSERSGLLSRILRSMKGT